LTKRFKVLSRKQDIRNSKVEEYATPYPRTIEDEERAINEKPCPYRNAFIRDRDRIVHSESFRKLQGKTQVFISELSPIVRNRLTHTMEVWQIAVSIARMLRANIDLTEAIALGHDLGHTPFGHAGESALDKIVIETKLEGFSHNEQSVKVVSLLESSPNINPNSQLDHPDIESVGLNLTKVTREGLFKHTNRFKDRCKDKKLYDEFGKDDGTIEAQIVRISDDIAQHTHDLNDFGKRGLVSKEDIRYAFSDTGDLVKDESFAEKQAISILIGALIENVVNTSLENLNDKYNGDPTKHEFITYSEDGQAFRDRLHKITENVIMGDEVNQMNSRGRYIIHTLFELYKRDPFCLPQSTKDRLRDITRKDLDDPKLYEYVSIENNYEKRVICDYISSMTDTDAIDVIRSTII
jgi:dGTPase